MSFRMGWSDMTLFEILKWLPGLDYVQMLSDAENMVINVITINRIKFVGYYVMFSSSLSFITIIIMIMFVIKRNVKLIILKAKHPICNGHFHWRWYTISYNHGSWITNFDSILHGEKIWDLWQIRYYCIVEN